MTKVISGNHSSVMVPRECRNDICKFYCDVLGGKGTKDVTDQFKTSHSGSNQNQPL